MNPHGFETAFFIGQPLKVLLVENSSADADRAVQALDDHGYEVNADVVSTPQAFAQKLGAGTYDVVLSDEVLPGWTGLEVLELMGQLQQRLPFILLAGDLTAAAAALIIDAGADDYVYKDRLQRLPLAVRRALRERRLFTELKQAAEERERLIATLQETLDEVKRLNGLLPICVTCKRVLNTKGFWSRIEHYIERYSDARISPSLCPECAAHQFPRSLN